MVKLSIDFGRIGYLKDTLVPPLKTIVANTGKYGYGVFCTRPIMKGEIIEECLVAKDRIPYGNNVFKHYRIKGVEVAPGKYDKVIALGNAVIYNHSSYPNIFFKENKNYERIITIYALRNISPGEELCWNYGYTPKQ